MANKTVTVLEADGVTETDLVVLDVGQQARAASKSVSLSTEDAALLDGVETAIASTNTKLDTAITALQIIDNMVLAAGSANIGDVDVASIAAGDNNIGNVDIVSLPALVAGTANIGDVDVLTVVTGTGATNLGKAIDSVPGATDTGVAMLVVRDDTLSTLTPADGDYTTLRVSSTGALHVTGSSGATEYTEDAAAAADPVGSMMMAVRRDTLSASEVSGDGDNIAVKATSKGQVHVLAEMTSAQFQAAGQLTAAASTSVVLASDQATIPVSLATAPVLVTGSAVIGKVDHTSTGLGHGVTTVTTAGTDVALAGSTAAKWVTIQAQTDNTNYVAVGASGVDATIATGTGVMLDAGESITLAVDNLADVFIDAVVSTEGVRYTYGT